jgi:hypothetical protein
MGQPSPEYKHAGFGLAHRPGFRIIVVEVHYGCLDVLQVAVFAWHLGGWQ